MKKQIKTIEEKLDEVVNGKKQGVHITLTTNARAEARNAMRERNLDIPEGFDGPHFKDVIGYQINGDWVAVSLPDGCTYVYPASNVARVKHYNVE